MTSLSMLGERLLPSLGIPTGRIYPDAGEKPFLLRFDINNQCNQRCPQCFYPGYAATNPPANSISVKDFETIAAKVFDYLYYLQLPFGFEPLIHPQFDRLLEIAASYKIANTGVVTNGTGLCGKNAEAMLATQAVTSLAVSLDTVDPKVYQSVRGRNHLDRVLRNVSEFCRERRRRGLRFPFVYINTVIMRSTLGQVADVLDWCAENGVDELQFIHVEPMELSNPHSLLHCRDEWNAMHDQLAEKIRKAPLRVFIPPRYEPHHFDAQGRYLRRFVQDETTSELESAASQSFDARASHPYPKGVYCVCPWMVLILDSWGNIKPCAHRPEPLGNLLHQDLETAINHPLHRELRRDLQNGHRAGACQRCRSKSPSSDPLRRKITRVLKTERPA